MKEACAQTAEILEELSKRSADAEKLNYCYECGTCTAACPVAKIFSRYYNPRVLLEKLSLGLRSVLTETGLWLCAVCYRCQKRCPHGLKIPEIFLSLREIAVERDYLQDVPGKFEETLAVLREEFPFPLTYSWLCLRPSKEESERSKFDNLILDVLQRTLKNLEKQEITPLSSKYKPKTMIIGSGPAGLTAAWELTRRGFPVTVFEALSKPGGMLRVGIPEYRLPKKVVDVETKHIQDLGVEIRTSTMVGKDLLFKDLVQEYKAIFIATGAHKSRELRVEGEKAKGVIHALDLLQQVNLQMRPELGKRVAVIGGGNTAMDAARIARRLGAKEVNVIYRRSMKEMPANPLEIEEAQKEGVKIHLLLAPIRILYEEKHATGVQCIRMKLGSIDSSGRRRPVPIKDSEFIMALDTIILAIGESPDTSFLPKEIEVTDWGTIAVDPLTLETNVPGVLAGGDTVSGPASVIEAIVAGKKAADSIEHYLKASGMCSR